MDSGFTLDELAGLVGIPPRTVRYYIQLDLVDRPEGETRAARYSRRHAEQLLSVKKWSEAGLSLEAIRDIVRGTGSTEVPVKPVRRGTVEVWSRLWLGDGVELQIEPGRAGLSPEQVRRLMKECLAAFDRVRGLQEEGER